MLNNDFVKWVTIACFIATPQDHVEWWIFILAGVFAMEIALIMVSWQSWKAATSNPVETLRYE